MGVCAHTCEYLQNSEKGVRSLTKPGATGGCEMPKMCAENQVDL